MKIEKGTTRVVLLIGDRAIKIAKVRPVRPVVRLLQLLRQGKVHSQLKTYDTNIGRGALKYLLAGFMANRREYKASRFDIQTAAPTSTRYFWGWVIIQERGRPVAVAQAKEHPFWAAMLKEAGDEAGAAKQFARFRDGTIRLVDLGRLELVCPVLANCHIM